MFTRIHRYVKIYEIPTADGLFLKSLLMHARVLRTQDPLESSAVVSEGF